MFVLCRYFALNNRSYHALNIYMNIYTEKVVIEIEQQNQKYYEINDSVTIKVLIKNVHNLSVNVYAINQKNYYINNGSEVDINMNLDGLNANWIINKEYKENSPDLLIAENPSKT